MKPPQSKRKVSGVRTAAKESFRKRNDGSLTIELKRIEQSRYVQDLYCEDAGFGGRPPLIEEMKSFNNTNHTNNSTSKKKALNYYS